MVQFVLISSRARALSACLRIVACVAILAVPLAADKHPKPPTAQSWPELLLDGGRKLSYERTLTSERDIKAKPGFWSKLVDVVIGGPTFRPMVLPYDVAVDSKGRIIVTDLALSAIHIFDVNSHKYSLIDRWDKTKDPMIEPQCVAVDDRDNIYVTDSKAGKVFVFDPQGKTRKVFGSIKGEGFFKRPTGISVDKETHRVYVTDTLRDKIYILDPDGKVEKTFGKSGTAPGEFAVPTHIHVSHGIIAVVDAMNFRVQLFDRDGNFQGMIGSTGDPSKGIYRPKGIAIDSESHVYVVDGQSGLVQVFNTKGQLLYFFGNGSGFGSFVLPAGLFIDNKDRVYVADSYNQRVQVFQYVAAKANVGGSNDQ